MIAIVSMGMLVHLAGTIIQQMSGDYCCYSKREYPVLVIMPVLFCQEQKNTGCEQSNGEPAMMVFPETMPKRINAYAKGKKDHKIFKCMVINDIHAKKG